MLLDYNRKDICRYLLCYSGLNILFIRLLVYFYDRVTGSSHFIVFEFEIDYVLYKRSLPKPLS